METALDSQLQALAPFAPPRPADDLHNLLKTGPKLFSILQLRGDKCAFILNITKAEVKRLVEMYLADSRFAKYLYDKYTSYSGFISFLTNSVEEFAENAAGKHGQLEYERAVW